MEIRMPRVITAIDAHVDPELEADLLNGYRELFNGQQPDGMIGSMLLRGQGGAWRIQTTWRDFDALLAVHNSGRPPAALELLDRLGAEHSHTVFVVEQSQGH
jgi:hypothetical protein